MITQWSELAGSALVARKGRFDLTVRRSRSRSCVRFLVRGHDEAREAPARSGTAADITQGMIAAEVIAERLDRAAVRARPLVIVVDDDYPIRKLIAEVLRDDGYTVTKASCGEGALRRLERTAAPTILVTDLNLGAGISGLELAATARELWPETGILLMSGDDEAPVGEVLLAKPFSIKQLLDQVALVATTMRRRPMS